VFLYKRAIYVVFLLDRNHLVSDSGDESVRFWDATTGQCLQSAIIYSDGSANGTIVVESGLAARSQAGVGKQDRRTAGQREKGRLGSWIRG
jgi:WD40 repeat protein